MASEFLKVVKLESPVAITAFDNSVRNETDFFYFKANVNASLPITITLLKHSEILVGVEGTGGNGNAVHDCQLFLQAAAKECRRNAMMRDGICRHCGRQHSTISLCKSEPISPRWSESPTSCHPRVPVNQPSMFASFRYPAGRVTIFVAPGHLYSPAAAIIILLPSAPASLRFNHTRVWVYSEDFVVAVMMAVGGVLLGTALWLAVWRRGQQRLHDGLRQLDATSMASASAIFVHVQPYGTATRACPLQLCRLLASPELLRARVSGLFLATGWTLVCFGLVPYVRYTAFRKDTAPNYDGYTGQRWTPEPIPGPFTYWLTLPGPGSLLMLMALLPIDAFAIKRACQIFTCVLLGLAGLAVFFVARNTFGVRSLNWIVRKQQLAIRSAKAGGRSPSNAETTAAVGTSPRLR